MTHDTCPICFAPWSVHRVTDACVVDAAAPDGPGPEPRGPPSRRFAHALAVASAAGDGTTARRIANLIAHALP
jgi:hypothetical protein